MNTSDGPSKPIAASPHHEGTLNTPAAMPELVGSASQELLGAAFTFFTKPTRYYKEDKTNCDDVQNTFSVMGEYLYNTGIEPATKEQIAHIAKKYISDPRIAEDFVTHMNEVFNALSKPKAPTR